MKTRTFASSLARQRLAFWLATLLLGALLAWAAGAARAAEPGDAGDPPARVGRLADLQGQVWIFSPETGEWIGAARNRVLTTGDRLATDGGARAELRIGSTTLRLDGNSEVEMARLDDERIDLRLHSGSLALRIRNRENLRDIAVLTGEGRFTFQRTGRYRVDRLDDASHLSVLGGQGLYEGPRSALTVNAGQRAEFWIDAAGVAQYSIVEPRQDAFAAWTAERDRAEDRTASSRYVSPEMTGVEDLDRYGRWTDSAEYGPLWMPYGVAPGWAPYSTGHWGWVAPWGWTWIDDAPWGFAPFHYGRWVWVGGAWGWAPGQRVARPVFAPALVAWIGGPNFSFSVTIGNGPAVGWFPLAPHEVYVPSYRASPIYVRNVNVTHVTNVTVIDNVLRRPPDPYDLRYRKFPHAVTVVPANVVTTRQPVGPFAERLRQDPAVRRIVEQPAVGSTVLAPPVAAPFVPRPGFKTATPPAPPRGERVAPVAPPRQPAPGRVERGEPREDRDRSNRGAPRSERDLRDDATRRPATPVPQPGAAPAPAAPAAPRPPRSPGRSAAEPAPKAQPQLAPAEPRAMPPQVRAPAPAAPAAPPRVAAPPAAHPPAGVAAPQPRQPGQVQPAPARPAEQGNGEGRKERPRDPRDEQRRER